MNKWGLWWIKFLESALSGYIKILHFHAWVSDACNKVQASNYCIDKLKKSGKFLSLYICEKWVLQVKTIKHI